MQGATVLILYAPLISKNIGQFHPESANLIYIYDYVSTFSLYKNGNRDPIYISIPGNNTVDGVSLL
jgi:hypothetical protein